MNTRALVIATITAFLGLAAQAQTTPAEGWSKTANLGLNLSFASSQDVIGQTDGSTETYGYNLNGGWSHKRQWDEWRTNVSLIASTTRTPSVPRWVKTSDETKVSTIFNRRFDMPIYMGPYVSAEASAPLYKGEDVRANPQAYSINHRDGTKSSTTQTSVHLTDALKPLTTKEAIGLLYKPTEDPRFSTEVRLGFAGLQISADGQYSVGAVDNGTVNIDELHSIRQLGVEASIAVTGKIDEKSGYSVGFSALTPFYTNKDSSDTRGGFELTNMEGFAKLTSNITKWASFGYDYKVKVQPQLQTRAQQLHLLVLNINYNLF